MTSRDHRSLAPWVGLLAFVLCLLQPLGPAAADETGSGKSSDDVVTVGVRTATEDGPDDRGTYDYEIPPKGVRQDYIALYNYGLRPVTVRLLARDATSTSDSSFEVQPSADEPVDLGSWIAIQKPVVRMAPKSETLVPFQVGVPYNATPGDHAGAVVVSLLVDPDDHAGEVVVERRVGLRVHLRVPGALKAELSITGLTSKFDSGWSSFGFGRSSVDYTLRNTGNVTLSADQVVKLASSFGLFGQEINPKKVDQLLPDGKVAVHVESPRTFAVGKLTTKVTATPSSDQQGLELTPVTSQVSHWVVPWSLLVLLAIAIALIAVATYFLRKWHRRRPPKVKNPSHRRKGLPDDQARAGLVGAGVGAGAPSDDDEGDPS